MINETRLSSQLGIIWVNIRHVSKSFVSMHFCVPLKPLFRWQFKPAGLALMHLICFCAYCIKRYEVRWVVLSKVNLVPKSI